MEKRDRSVGRILTYWGDGYSTLAPQNLGLAVWPVEALPLWEFLAGVPNAPQPQDVEHT